MTGQPSTGHAAFDELTVGFALDALEPGEEAVLLKHLPGCVRCQESLATHRAIAAELALAFQDDADEVPISPALAQAMASKPHRLPIDPFPEPMATTGRVPAQPTFTRPRISVPSPTHGSGVMRQARRVLIGAGALGIVAAVSLSAYDVHLRREPVAVTKGGGALSALADSQATIAHLSGPTTTHASATAVVANGHAWLVSNGLAPTAKNASYVVWEFESGDKVKPLAAFSATASTMPVVVDLGATPTANAGYGVTLEPQSADKPLPATPNGKTVLYELADGNVPVN